MPAFNKILVFQPKPTISEFNAHTKYSKPLIDLKSLIQTLGTKTLNVITNTTTSPPPPQKNEHKNSLLRLHYLYLSVVIPISLDNDVTDSRIQQIELQPLFGTDQLVSRTRTFLQLFEEMHSLFL